MCPEKRPNREKHSREELQRMRAEVCGFIDRTPHALSFDPETGQYKLDIALVTERDYASHFSICYVEDPQALIDDAMFYRFIKAANTFLSASDSVVRRGIAEQDLIPYIRYLLNTPRTTKEEKRMKASGNQSFGETEGEKEKIRNLINYMLLPDEILPFKRPGPRFSPEYKKHLLEIREGYLQGPKEPIQINPEDIDPENPFYPVRDKLAKLFESAQYGKIDVLGLPGDTIRDNLPPAPRENFLPVPREDEDEELLPEGELPLTRKALAERVNATLAELDPLQRRVIILGMGLLDRVARTTAEIAKELGITIEEVKRLERNAFKSMRKKDKKR